MIFVSHSFLGKFFQKHLRTEDRKNHIKNLTFCIAYAILEQSS